MKIESFTIKNYRSIKALKMDNLNPVNVLFGQNNVGKSNILRGLHLAFYSLKNDELFLSDTMFFNRNIYRPIEITIDLTLEEDFCNMEKISNTLRKRIEDISLVISQGEMLNIKEVDKFIKESESFRPLKKLRIKTSLDFNEETSDIKILIKDLESNYKFDYGKYKILYKELESILKRKASTQLRRSIEPLLSELSSLGVDVEEIFPSHRWLERSFLGSEEQTVENANMLVMRLRRYIARIKESAKKERAVRLLEQYREILQSKHSSLEPFSKIFDMTRGYFEKISDSLILIPNKEHFSKVPLVEEEENGEEIEIFNINRFFDKLLSLIESPNKKERELIRRFNNIFSKSYSNLGRLEIRKFRDRVFAIFDTGFIDLPIENQGLGVQDLFIYLAHMILFDSAIIAIEEPEGGLSTENQRILHNVIKDIYSGNDKQIFISSHSDEFETPNSYIIEMGREGTKEISRMKKEKEYEEKIDRIFSNRKLAEEREHYKALLREIAEREITLDILNYINKLSNEEKINAQKISDELKYPKEKVQEILKEIIEKK